MPKNKTMSGDEFKNSLISAMSSAHISVFVDPSGQMREYSFLLPTGDFVALSWECFDTDCEYVIEVNEHKVISVVIPRGRQICSYEEQMVLDIFRTCTIQVMMQERMMLHLHQNSKTYS